MSISAQAVMELRKKTGVSMMACKKALTEANGDMDAAVEILRKSGEAKAMKKADRETSEGMIYGEIRGNKGMLIKVACETDFVARNDAFTDLAKNMLEKAFEHGTDHEAGHMTDLAKEAVITLGENIQCSEVQEIEGDHIYMYIHANNKVGAMVAISEANEELGRDLAMQVVAANPSVVNPDDVDSSLVEKEKEFFREQLRAEGKPEEMLEKIMEGKVRKFKEEKALLTQAFIKDPSKKVSDVAGGVSVSGFITLSI